MERRTIGRVATYTGSEFTFLSGLEVRVVAVIRDDDYITDEGELRRAGGLRRWDRVEVQPWIEELGRFSFVTSDPRAVDLDGLL